MLEGKHVPLGLGTPPHPPGKAGGRGLEEAIMATLPLQLDGAKMDG